MTTIIKKRKEERKNETTKAIMCKNTLYTNRILKLLCFIYFNIVKVERNLKDTRIFNQFRAMQLLEIILKIL